MQKDLISAEQGRWNSAEWRLLISDTIPDESAVTAVFALAFNSKGLALTKNHRGWELPGGHREPGETLYQTLSREISEEAGIKDFDSEDKPLGYLEVMDDKPKLNKATGVNYPNPSYIAYYAIDIKQEELLPPTGHEILECALFDLDELPEIEGDTAKRVIPHLIKAAKTKTT